MPFIEWSEDLSVGVSLFDDEHKKLVSILNTLYDALAEGVDQATLQTICDDLVEYTLLHFRHEEMYFEDWNFPGKNAHIASHRTLRERVFAYRRELLARPTTQLANELMVFLRDWLTQHILVEDREYGKFLFEKGLR